MSSVFTAKSKSTHSKRERMAERKQRTEDSLKSTIDFHERIMTDLNELATQYLSEMAYENDKLKESKSYDFVKIKSAELDHKLSLFRSFIEDLPIMFKDKLLINSDDSAASDDETELVDMQSLAESLSDTKLSAADIQRTLESNVRSESSKILRPSTSESLQDEDIPELGSLFPNPVMSNISSKKSKQAHDEHSNSSVGALYPISTQLTQNTHHNKVQRGASSAVSSTLSQRMINDILIMTPKTFPRSVQICHIAEGPGSFYVQCLDRYQNLVCMEEDIASLMTSTNIQSSAKPRQIDPRKDLPCAAIVYSEQFGGYFRANAHDFINDFVEGPLIKVEFIDWGNRADVKEAFCFLLPDNYKDIASFAIHCYINGPHPPERELKWSDVAMKYFNDQFLNETFSAKLTKAPYSINGDKLKYCVEMADGRGVDLFERLEETGHYPKLVPMKSSNNN